MTNTFPAMDEIRLVQQAFRVFGWPVNAVGKAGYPTITVEDGFIIIGGWLYIELTDVEIPTIGKTITLPGYKLTKSVPIPGGPDAPDDIDVVEIATEQNFGLIIIKAVTVYAEFAASMWWEEKCNEALAKEINDEQIPF
jgi:hypothetical protein